MTKPAPTDVAVRAGDWVIALLLLVVFVGALLAAQGWPFKAALFPQMVSITGTVLTVLALVGLVLRWRGFRLQPEVAPTVGDIALVSEEEEEDVDLEYVFASAGRAAWIRALAWIAGFFLALWLLGVLVTVPIFAVAYTRLAGEASWRASLTYGAGLFALMFATFELLPIEIPMGIFG